MHHHIVTDGDPVCAKDCAARCRRPIVAGDVLMVVDQGPAVYVHRLLYFHRRCVAAAVEVAPLERTETARRAAELRARGPLRLVV